MELLDVYDENNECLEYRTDRKIVHERKLWHRHVSCWIMNNKGEILLQQRSFNKKKNPGMWAKTEGHVESGETPDQAIKREVFEEIGLKTDNIKNIDIFKSNNTNENYYSYGYILFTNLEIEEFSLQKEEVEQVKYFTIEELEKYKENNESDFTFFKWDKKSFDNQMEILKVYRQNISEYNTKEI